MWRQHLCLPMGTHASTIYDVINYNNGFSYLSVVLLYVVAMYLFSLVGFIK